MKKIWIVYKSCALFTLKIFLWKLRVERSSTNENVIMENNETIEICVNDEFMEENINVQT
jgi:hypothetical protein